MRNRNRKITPKKEKREKQVRVNGNNEDVVKERKVKMTIAEMASIIIALAALVVSVLAFWNQSQYAELEYQYKLDPEIEPEAMMGVTVKQGEEGQEVMLNVSECRFHVSQKNNLQSAYLIYDDYEIEKINVDEIEDTLELKWDEQRNKSGIVVNGVIYHYEFLFMQGLDGSCELSLVYSREGNTECIGLDAVSGIEILELEKAHEGEADYEGERELAKKYLEVLEACNKYMIQ